MRFTGALIGPGLELLAYRNNFFSRTYKGDLRYET
jgi:hypothetical protein